MKSCAKSIACCIFCNVIDRRHRRELAALDVEIAEEVEALRSVLSNADSL